MSTGTALPEALRPWHPWLDWFEPELAEALGALLQRMQPLLGRFRGQVRSGPPEPDGLDDLRRRGRYERLLTTEWLLADELPDEFLRRAASSEHLFLAPRPRARQTEKGIVAIFDAGPLQLGAPRLGHLALWILLARRAAQTGSALQWGVLQAPGRLHDAQDRRQLQALMRSRSFSLAEAGHAEAWRAALAALAHPPGESWLIGAQRAEQPASACWTSHRVRLSRAVEGGVLEVALAEKAGVRRAQLPLPPVQAAVQLLRGEFEQALAVGAHQHHDGRLSLHRPPVISVSGRHVAVPLLDGAGVVTFAVPQPKQAKPGKIGHQRWFRSAEPLAMAFGGKKLGALLTLGQGFALWGIASRSFEFDEGQAFSGPPGLGKWLPMAWLRHNGHERVCLLDQGGRLLAWSELPGHFHGAPKLVEGNVLCISQWADDGLVYVVRRSGRLMLCRYGVHDGPSTMMPMGDAPEGTKVLLAGGALWRRALGGCAVRLDEQGGWENWRLHVPDRSYAGPYGEHPKAWQTFELRAHGALALFHDTTRQRFALLGLSPDRTGLILHSAGRAETVYVAPKRIEKISVCPNTGLAAMLTVHRQLILYAVRERALRAVFHGTGGGDG